MAAYAIAESVPDATVVVQTVAGGYGVIGMEVGFRRAEKAGGSPHAEQVDADAVMFQAADLDTLAYAIGRGVSELDRG